MASKASNDGGLVGIQKPAGDSAGGPEVRQLWLNAVGDSGSYCMN